jgi:predicted neuraminidase
MLNRRTFCGALAAGALASRAAAAEPFLRSEFIFPLEHWHNHGSSLAELPNGDIFVVWYNGSGERTADDVKVEASRLRKGAKTWDARYTIADVPEFPDCNVTVFLDSKERLWMLWPTIIANEWHTALLNYRISTNYMNPDTPPVWDVAAPLLFKPLNFEEKVKRAVEPALKKATAGSREENYLKDVLAKAGDKYFRRMGWMPRAHPTELPSGRILIPLYSDGYSFSIIAYTDDGGRTWHGSDPIVGHGAVQPSIVRRTDGVLVAYMRDNGPPPKRLMVSLSKDDGVTWSDAVDTDIPNPGAGAETIVLRDGTWLLINNDLERGRHQLAVWLSDDEGKTWKWKRYLENDRRGEGAGSFHYPSIVQGRDGTLHATYSYFLNHLAKDAPRKTIKYAHFNVEWVQQGG